MKIPTAEEFLKREDLPTDILSGDDINYAMIEFAKLHVEAALKAADEKAEVEEIWDNPINPSMGISYGVDKDSILNSYPLENIK